MSDTLLPQIAQHLSKAGDAALTIPRLQAVVAGFLLVEAASEGATTAIRNAEKAIDAAKTGEAVTAAIADAKRAIADAKTGEEVTDANAVAKKAIDAAKTGAAACVEAYGAAQIARIEFGKQLSNLNLTA